MRIGGLQKTSLIDYPGNISAVVFAVGCNFHCPYCHNPTLVNPEISLPAHCSPEEVLAFLDRRRGLLQAVVISGGEPLLQPDLMDFCREIRSLQYRLKIDTNGSRPRQLQRLLDAGLVDYVAMDIKTDPDRYAPDLWAHGRPEPILQSIRILMEAAPDYEFRTTCVYPFVTAGVVQTIARRIAGARRFVLQGYQAVDVLRPEFFEGIDPRIPPREMESLAALAAPYVGQCCVR
ncbi:MAG TPA: anaerobic ribonucleoside-triphosphate reductase activating protein [Desulfobacterales bacterium]